MNHQLLSLSDVACVARARLPQRVARGIGFAALLLASVNCIALENNDPLYEPMCASTSECDGGEYCDEGICWGNPPAGRFAAILSPPVDGRADLATTHIPDLVIASDGTLENLVFAEAIEISGRAILHCDGVMTVECDPSTSVAARISFTTPSSIPGQPAYTRTVISEPGLPPEQASFSIALPRSEVEYQVQVLPLSGLDGSGETALAAALAPPRNLVLIADTDLQVEWHLGAPETHVDVSGRVVDVVEQGIADMQVFALAVDAPLAADERISTITTTDAEGFFTLKMPISWEDSFDLVAIPRTDDTMPVLRARERGPIEPDPQGVTDVGVLIQPGYGSPVSYTIPVRGIDNNGDEVPVSGATLSMTTVVSGLEEDTMAMYATTAFTDETGKAEMQLIPSNGMENRVYIADIAPLDGSQYATLYAHQIEIGAPQGGVVEEIVLGRRVAVGGQIVTADGEPAADTTVEARLAPGFRQGLGPEQRRLVDGLSLPSAVTDQIGVFVLWLDDTLAGRDAVYTLRLTPGDPLAAVWSIDEVSMSEQSEFDTVDLPAIVLPTAAYARGIATAADGAAVPGAEVRLFELRDEDSACAPGAEAMCVSVFRDLSDADKEGEVMLVLPE